jgi:peptide chain release factor 2
LAKKTERVEELQREMETPAFWNDTNEARRVIAESNRLKLWTIPYKDLKERFDLVKGLLLEAFQEGEERFYQELSLELQKIDKELSVLEVRRMLSGELDDKNCYLSINAGAGGTESCDWVLMLSRMYQRWAVKKGWIVEEIDSVDGDVAGLKSITLRVSAPFAYGYCKAERGVHRLVRISPFDANARRHTSFASVDVTPEIDDDIQISIRPEDLRIDTFRASGAGGQHVNRTDSAVRVTHLPTGIVTSSQKERSQLQNKETCIKMLRAKLYELEILKRENQLKELGGEKREIAWGSQIRNYVFQPYTLVKDARTGHEVGNIEAMMDGEVLDGFIIAYLKEFS